jgi:hypothetical protein
VQVEQGKEVQGARVLPVAVGGMRRSSRHGFNALRREAESRRRSENLRILVSIAGIAALIALLGHVLAG